MTAGLVNSGVVANSYWDTQRSGTTFSGGGEGKTTIEMKQRATFQNWDFDNIWAIEEETDYPYLKWQTGESDADGDGEDLACPATTVSLTASGNTLQWTSENATTTFINNGFGIVDINGSVSVPPVTKTYTISESDYSFTWERKFIVCRRFFQ